MIKCSLKLANTFTERKRKMYAACNKKASFRIKKGNPSFLIFQLNKTEKNNVRHLWMRSSVDYYIKILLKNGEKQNSFDKLVT